MVVFGNFYHVNREINGGVHDSFCHKTKKAVSVLTVELRKSTKPTTVTKRVGTRFVRGVRAVRVDIDGLSGVVRVVKMKTKLKRNDLIATLKLILNRLLDGQICDLIC